MVLATMPRVFAPGEIIKLPVTVFAMENNIRNVNVACSPTNSWKYREIIPNL